ncbi:hypothetical protein ACJJTC_001132 [Scirpophaga incertulas]
MSAEQKRNLPQEGTGLAGESLPEHDSGCPTYSGGGNVLHHMEPMIQKENTSTRRLVQQAFHPSLFITRPRSQSLSSVLDTKNPVPTHLADPETPNSSPEPDPPTWQRAPVLRNPKRKKLSPPTPEKIATNNQFSGLPLTSLAPTTSYGYKNTQTSLQDSLPFLKQSVD